MNFNSLAFLIFLPAVVLLYWLLPHKFRWVLLLAASYFFYMSWNAWLIVLIMTTTVTAYVTSILISRTQKTALRRLWLAVALVMIAVLGANQALSPAASVGAALAGSLAAMCVVLAMARRVRSQGMLIVAGVMVGYVCQAATNFLVAFADDQSIVNLHNWSQGSFSGTAWPEVAAAAVTVATVSAAVFALSKPLGAYQLGENYARGVGVSVMALRMLIIVASTLLAACVAAFAGPISFVGIAAPHLAKLAVGSSKPIVVTPACLLTGAVFCCGCDLVARTLFAPVELSVSAVTAVFGAPVVIALMLKKRGLR